MIYPNVFYTLINLGYSPNMVVQIARVDTGHAKFHSIHNGPLKRHHIIKCSCSLNKT
jgi:hypothetical protein